MTLEHSPTKKSENPGNEPGRVYAGTNIGVESAMDQQPPTSQSDTRCREDLIAMVSPIKLPQFWEGDPESWIGQAEAIFAATRITSDNSRYAYIISCLDNNALRQVSDIVRNPLDTEKYQTIKRALVKRFSLSRQREITTLLSG